MNLCALRAGILSIGLGVFAMPASSQNTSADIAATLHDAISAPAVVVARLADGASQVEALGERASGSGVAVTAGDNWHVASNTKAMTATLIARLVERGEVSWDDTVEGVLGDIIDEIDPAYRAATYADLMAHRTGMMPNIGYFARRKLNDVDAARDTPADRVAFAITALGSAPEAAAPYPFKYSNAAYVVAGAMLEARTGKSWEELIRTHVFDPLDMESASFGPPGSLSEIDQPRGHKSTLFSGWKAMPPDASADNIPAMSPAGRVNIAMEDLLKFLDMHARRDPDFLSPESWDRLHTPKEGEDYVAGWVVEGDILTHNGSNTLWYSHAGFNAQTGAVAAIVANAADPETIDRVVAKRLKEMLRAEP